MSYKLFFWIVSLVILMVALFAYNNPVEGASLHSEARTAAASTLLAMVTPQHTATALPIRTVVLPSNTPISQPTVTYTPTYSVPMLTLREATNCRTGPGVAYEIIVTYPIGQTLEILGHYEPENIWLVKSSESRTGNCWLWGEYADVNGSYEAVVSVTPPPTPIASSFLAPSLQKYEYGCDDINGTFSFWMIWEDRAGNETGYRIFRDGGLVAELPAGSTNYAETIIMPADRSAEYSVQVYNATASASIVVEREKLKCD
jgi:uncharacterized protein YraI